MHQQDHLAQSARGFALAKADTLIEEIKHQRQFDWLVEQLARRLARASLSGAPIGHILRPEEIAEFSRRAGLSPDEFVTQLRVEAAAVLLLREPRTKIAAIASAVSIEIRTFQKLFRAHFGKTPSVWRGHCNWTRGSRWRTACGRDDIPAPIKDGTYCRYCGAEARLLAEIKAVSIKEPGASLVGQGVKKILTFSRPTKYRGNILVCSSNDRRVTPFEERSKAALGSIFGNHLTVHQLYRRLRFGQAVATAELYDCVEIGLDFEVGEERFFGNFTPGRFAWLLRGITPVDPGIKVVGESGQLFKTTVPLEAVAEEAQCLA